MTEQSVRAVVEASETAWKQSNLDQIAQYNAPNCIINSTAPQPDGTINNVTKTCQQAIDRTRNNLAQMKKSGVTYRYESTAPRIAVLGGKATARFSATISLSNAKTSLVTESDQVETLQLVKGKMRIAVVDVKTTSITVDGQRKF